MNNDTYSQDPVAGTTGAESLNYPALIGSVLHQIRFLHSREMTKGMMFYSIATTDGTVVKVPSHYMPDNRKAYYESVQFLEQLLHPYMNAEHLERLNVCWEEGKQIKKKVKDKYEKILEEEGKESELHLFTQNERPKWLDLMEEEQARNLKTVFDKRFANCISVIHKLNLLPNQVTAKDKYEGKVIL